MPKHYLWVIGEGIKTYRPGEIIVDRYQVQDDRILMDTQPEKTPQMPEEIPGKIEPYLRLFPYRLHIPQVFGIISVTEKKGTRKIWLLEAGPINSNSGSLMPKIATSWKHATAMRQLNWLWQIAQLWQPLNVQKVASSLLNSENLRVEGQLVRLLELQADQKSLTLQHLGRFWQKWASNAHPAVEKFLKQLFHQMIAGEVYNADQVIVQLDQALELLGRSQTRKINIATATDTGPNRSNNEDACYPPSKTAISYPPSYKTVAMVCDGIGGQEGGEEASELAIKVLCQRLHNIPEDGDPLTIITKLEESAYAANDAIYERNDNEQRQGRQRMGTTLVMALAHLHELYIAHVGDSRAYWITPTRCYQVTLDDDVATRQVRLGYSLYQDAVNQIASGALVQALGITASTSLHPTVQRFPIDEDSIFLICSDGLSDRNRVEEYWQTEILPLLEGKTNLATVRDRLIEIANTINGHDNVTVALVYYQVTDKGQITELSVPPVKVQHLKVEKSRKNSEFNSSDNQFFDNKPKNFPYDSEYKSGWFYLSGILILLVLGGILAYFLSPLVKGLTEQKKITQPLDVSSPKNNTFAGNTKNPSQQTNSIFSPSLSLDIGSFILISHGGHDRESLHEPIELLNNTTNKTVKGTVGDGSILQVTRKLNQSEENWLELQVCATETPSNIDLEFSNFLLQPKDKGWIQQAKIESSSDVIILEKNSEKLDGCVED
ncbi:MAG: SpoIIE family protein phosphatase [Okeania sp. SIO2G4]|uniref:protein phosphatase 2C domain-containing protein n=1 Tax=unclassified Okeania TaxID=2634635 RepID=UPI0013BCAC0A|nr:MULTISPECIES: protein phosphatase 2C domain-containing protein [unclassified Okeania]NEP75913.1 SpoIIE family protein phosphatase [Okeania sp. SIO2G5]NEP91948.1 SpoIIE family protein phosphatase [Okeania sp. SIO2F5]NEQ94776.1 SpoIIE family protein phosphatase [Okeania sp. SIO2G4]